MKEVVFRTIAHMLRTTEILKAAHNHGGTALKRFVLLGSAVSALNSFEDQSREGKPYTEKDWNPVSKDVTHFITKSHLSYVDTGDG